MALLLVTPAGANAESRGPCVSTARWTPDMPWRAFRGDGKERWEFRGDGDADGRKFEPMKARR